MKKTIFTILIMATLLLISGCGTPNTYGTNFYTGSEGLVIDFYENAPPDTVFASSENNPGSTNLESIIPVDVTIKNKGTYDLNSSNPGFIIMSYDDHYFENIEQQQYLGPYMVDVPIILHGKSIYWPQGEEELRHVADLKVRPLQGQIATPKTQILLTSCYPYQTLFNKEVCMDMNIYSQDVRPQACSSEILELEDQGAPIAITRVEPTFLPVTQTDNQGFVTPRFSIHIENVGGGVSWNYDDSVLVRDACSLRASDKTTENELTVNAWLSTESLVCRPEPIRLIQNQVDVICETRNPVKIQTNYMTTLRIEIDYLYTDSVSKTIQITRS